MIDARDMIAIKVLGNAAAIKVLLALKAGFADIIELADACGITPTYVRLVMGKLVAHGFVSAPRPTDLANARLTVVERMAELAQAIECIDANGEPIEPTPPRRGDKGDITANVLSCIPCCRSIRAIAVMARTDYMSAWTAFNLGISDGLVIVPDGMRALEALASGQLEFSADRVKAQVAEVMA